MDATYSFSVESEVLGIRLSDYNLDILFHKQSDTLDIFLQISTGITLVGRIEERKETSLLEQDSQLSPLLQIEIYSSRVMSTGMQKHNTTRVSLRQTIEHPLEVQSSSTGFVVRISQHIQTSFFDDGIMVAPGRVGDIHITRTMFTQELEGHSQSTSATQTLESHYSILLHQLTVCSKDQFLTLYIELGQSINRQVLFVQSASFSLGC